MKFTIEYIIIKLNYNKNPLNILSLENQKKKL